MSGKLTMVEWKSFRKKPVVVRAYQTTEPLEIETLEGVMMANAGDWIIEGVKGERCPCKPDIFEATYEAVGEGQMVGAATLMMAGPWEKPPSFVTITVPESVKEIFADNNQVNAAIHLVASGQMSPLELLAHAGIVITGDVPDFLRKRDAGNADCNGSDDVAPGTARDE